MMIWPLDFYFGTTRPCDVDGCPHRATIALTHVPYGSSTYHCLTEMAHVPTALWQHLDLQ